MEAIKLANLTLEQSRNELTLIKEKMKNNQLEDYRFLRDKVAAILGDKKQAEDVLREAMIQEVNADAKDGINIFVTDERPTIKFNNFPNVEISKHQPVSEQHISVDVYPGETHKPQVTFVKTDNFRWGLFNDEEPI